MERVEKQREDLSVGGLGKEKYGIAAKLFSIHSGLNKYLRHTAERVCIAQSIFNFEKLWRYEIACNEIEN